MIDLNELIGQTFGTIESVIPDAIVHGRLVKYDSVYDRVTATYINTVVDEQKVKGVYDYSDELFRTAENTDTIESKLHIFGLLSKPVELFDELEITTSEGVIKYKTDKLRKINVGESSVLHTFIITR